MAKERTRLAGEVLELPLPKLVRQLCMAIAEAQQELDQNAVNVLKTLAETRIEGLGEEPQSLLYYGFVPSFYQIAEATVRAKLTFSIQMSQSVEVGASAGVNLGLFAASFNASYSNRFAFEASGASEITARLVAVPPPTALLDAAKERAR